MTKDILDMLKELKSNSLSREIFYCISGLFLLITLNFLFKPSAVTYPNWIYLNTFTQGAILIIGGYFLSRFCNELGIFLTRISMFIIKKNKISGIKEQLLDIRKYINQESVDILKNRDVNHAELDRFIQNDNSLLFLFERKIQMSIFEKIFLGFTFLLGISYSPYVLIASLVLLISTISTDVDIFKNEIDVARFLPDTKEKEQK